MSMLEEISIQGIRSYHPQEKQTVKFKKPLTLILGQNGCGKTTIIECLKYITCSDQPKNTKTGGFVWDPKLSDHHAVKGNVKLKFRDTNNVDVIVSKTLESTQKLKTVTTRTLDQTVSRKGQSTSHKCSDVDEVMCTYLGVSRSILKDVIFCHQEDSSWPLDEDKKVKEKFDSIFDVGKYDKCIEQIRKEIKFIREDKKTTKTDLEYLKAYREDARNKRASLDDKKNKLAELQQKMNKIETDMNPLEKRYNAILYIEENLSTLKNSLLNSEGHLKSIMLSQKELKSVIKIDFQGNDLELEEAIKNFNNNVLQKETEKIKLIQNKNNAINTEKKIQENISKEQINFGQYQSEEKQNQNNVQKQFKKITELGHAMEMILPKVSEFNSLEVIDELSQKLNFINDKLKSTQKDHAKNEIKMQSNIDSLRVEKAKLDQEIKIKEKQIVGNISEIKKLKEVVEKVKYSAEKLTELQKLKDDNENNLKTLKKSFDVNTIKIELDVKKKEKYDVTKKLEIIEKEVQQLQLLSVEQAELDNIKTNKLGIENKLQILKNKVNNVLNDLLGTLPQEKLKYEFTTFLDKLSNTIRSNRNCIAEKQKQLTILEANYNHTKDKLRAKQRDVSDDENALSDMCQGQEYETILKEVNENIEELQDLKGSVSTSSLLFKRYIKNLEAQDPCCPLCHRGFSSIDEVTELISDLNVRVQKIPSELEMTITKLESLLDKQSKLQQLKPTYTRISILNKTEIPNIKLELEKIGNDLKCKRNELSKLLEENGKLETNEISGKSIQADVIMIDSYYNDLKRYKKDEQNLLSKLNESGSTRNLQEAITEQKALRTILKDICSSLDKKQHELNEYNEKLYKLQTEQNKIVTDELNLKREMQDEKGIMDKLNDLQNLELTLSLELDNAKETVEPIQEKLNECINNFEQTKNQQNKKIENDRKKIISFENKLQEITNLQTLINDYEKKGWSLRIKETTNLLDKLLKEKMQYVEAQNNFQKDIDFINDYNARQEIQKIDLENNKKLRQTIKEEIKCLNEINKLKDEVGNMDVNNLIQEKRSINENIETLFKEKNKSLGRKQELETTIDNAKKELMDSRFQYAEKNYLHKKVKSEILNRVENDLTKYIRALEYSLNRFHAEHMLSINSIIKTLWRDIYTGNDIDYIQIKTSDDDKAIQSDSSKRRLFNYRVVQIKNDIELDMRGRCSAGQKVLACLIVRMALAETFSKQCGILALDEPTTNLDESNIQSLAESLSEIITRRSSQKSFQLIIITHDPNFLRKLSARDMIDYYYEVKRNKEGASILNEVDIRHLS